MTLSLLFLFLLTGTCWADDVETDLTNGRVFEALADYSAAIADLENQRYAVVGRGSKTSISNRTNDLIEQKIIWVAAKDGKDTLHGRAVEVTSNGRVNQMWNERIADAGQVRYRHKMGGSSNASYDRTNGKDDDDYEMMLKSEFLSVYPLELPATPVSVERGFPLKGRGAFIDQIVTSGELEVAKFDENGDIVSDWVFRTEGQPNSGHLRLVLGKKYNFLPIETYHESKIKNDGRNLVIRLGQVNTEWQKQGDRWLPKNVEVTLFGRTETFYNLSFRWKVDKQIPKKPTLVNIELDDWSNPVRDLFGETWQVKGQLPVLVTQEKVK